MTKAEMEQHSAAYHALMDQVSAAVRGGSYREAVDLAVSSFSHVDGMMQFDKKYGGKETTSVASIDLVLQYAPLMFDVEWGASGFVDGPVSYLSRGCWVSNWAGETYPSEECKRSAL